MHNFFHLMVRWGFHAAQQIYDRNGFVSERDKYKLIVLLLSFMTLYPGGRVHTNNRFVIKHALLEVASTFWRKEKGPLLIYYSAKVIIILGFNY